MKSINNDIYNEGSVELLQIWYILATTWRIRNSHRLAKLRENFIRNTSLEFSSFTKAINRNIVLLFTTSNIVYHVHCTTTENALSFTKFRSQGKLLCFHHKNSQHWSSMRFAKVFYHKFPDSDALILRRGTAGRAAGSTRGSRARRWAARPPMTSRMTSAPSAPRGYWTAWYTLSSRRKLISKLDSQSL